MSTIRVATYVSYAYLLGSLLLTLSPALLLLPGGPASGALCLEARTGSVWLTPNPMQTPARCCHLPDTQRLNGSRVSEWETPRSLAAADT